jgi:hypothetical protein
VTIYALDPGPEQSALVRYQAETVQGWQMTNPELIDWLGVHVKAERGVLVIEQVAGYGMPVGAEVFETVFWSGRFAERWQTGGGAWARLPRRIVKLQLCGSSRANDATIRQALLDRYGPGREKAVGTKANPGPLYGIKADLWQALALAVTYSDQMATP